MIISPSCSGQTPARGGPDGRGIGLAVGELKEVGDVPLALGSGRPEEASHDEDGEKDVSEARGVVKLDNVPLPSEVRRPEGPVPGIE